MESLETKYLLYTVSPGNKTWKSPTRKKTTPIRSAPNENCSLIEAFLYWLGINLVLPAEELLNCISSAAATAQKASPAARKPRVMAKPQPSRFFEQDQARVRSAAPKKRRLMTQEDTASQHHQVTIYDDAS